MITGSSDVLRKSRNYEQKLFPLSVLKMVVKAHHPRSRDSRTFLSWKFDQRWRLVKDINLRRRLLGHVAHMHPANWIPMLMTSGKLKKTSSFNFIFQGTVSSCHVFSICASNCLEVHCERGILQNFLRQLLLL